MTDEASRRRVVACAGTTLAVGLAGCSGGGDGTSGDGDDGGGETPTGTTGGQTESTPAGDGNPLTLELHGTTDYESEVVTVESLTFVAASADDDSPTVQVGETVDISEGDSQNPVVVADDLVIPYGTYESTEMTVTPEEVTDSEGSPIDVSAGTVSMSFTDLDDEPNTVEEGQFDSNLRLNLDIRHGQYRVSGWTATAI